MSSTEWLQHLSPKQRSEYVNGKVLEAIPYEPDRIWRKTLFKGFEFSAPTLQDSVKRLEKEGQIRIDKKKGRVHYSRIGGAKIRSSLEEIKIASTRAVLMDIKSEIEKIGKPVYIKDRDIGDLYYEIIKDCFKMLNRIYCGVFGLSPRNEDGEVLYIIASDVDVFAIYRGLNLYGELMNGVQDKSDS